MLERRRIARREILIAVAQETATIYPLFDAKQFARDLDSQAIQDAFREDLKDVRYREIGRFPTLILRPASGRSIILVGYRPYPVLCDALAQVAPNLMPLYVASDVVDYIANWGRITSCEIAEGLGVEQNTATQSLAAAKDAGQVGQQDQLYFPLEKPLVAQ